MSEKVSPLPYLTVLTLISVVLFFTLFPLLYFGRSFHFTTDVDNGIFGWLAKENFWYNFLVISGINGVFTLWLQMLVFKYFSPVIAGTMMLLEPMFSQVYGIILGLDEYPGSITYVGGILILGGLYVLLVYEGEGE